MWDWESDTTKHLVLKSSWISSMLKLDDIGRRARSMLARRSDEEMAAAADNVDAFIERYFEDAPYASAGFQRGVISDARAIRDVLPAYDLDSDPDFPNGEVYEYFAVLALCHALDGGLHLDRAHNASAAGKTIRRNAGGDVTGMTVTDLLNDPVTWWHEAARHALEAMEAICWAERLRDEKMQMAIDRINQQVAEETRLAAELGAATKKAFQR